MPVLDGNASDRILALFNEKSRRMPPPDSPMEQSMFCPRCGSKNPPGARFCQNCRGEMPRL
ncbi:MAG: zinc ribbon domain-containing protein [Candidatus Thermoplasmatota archaeon]|nr:zinc ribbon domain-containing protein [Candidatus Thermoplasmatota archaeon]